MENNMRERRRVRIVKMQFQRGFILKFCAVIIFSSLALSAIVYWLSASTSTTVFQNSRLVIKSTADFLLPLLLLSGLIAVITSAIATIILTLFVSHHIAGPLFRMEKDIAQVSEGNLGVNFHLRPKDQLLELAGSLNLMLKSIRDTLTEINKEISGITASGLSGQEQERIENIRNLLKKFKC